MSPGCHGGAGVGRFPRGYRAGRRPRAVHLDRRRKTRLQILRRWQSSPAVPPQPSGPTTVGPSTRGGTGSSAGGRRPHPVGPFFNNNWAWTLATRQVGWVITVYASDDDNGPLTAVSRHATAPTARPPVAPALGSPAGAARTPRASSRLTSSAPDRAHYDDAELERRKELHGWLHPRRQAPAGRDPVQLRGAADRRLSCRPNTADPSKTSIHSSVAATTRFATPGLPRRPVQVARLMGRMSANRAAMARADWCAVLDSGTAISTPSRTSVSPAASYGAPNWHTDHVHIEP